MTRHIALVPTAAGVSDAWLRDAVAQGDTGVIVHVAGDQDALPRMASVIAAMEDRAVFHQVVLDVGPSGTTSRTLAQLAVKVPVVRLPEGINVPEDVHDTLRDSGCTALVVHADTHAALCCALAAARLGQAIVRVGAAPQNGPGRVLTQLADVLLTRSPSDTDASAARIPSERVTVVGDPLVDLVQRYARDALAAGAWRHYGVAPGSYALAILTGGPAKPQVNKQLLALASAGPLLLDAPDHYAVPGARRVTALTFLERLSLERAAKTIFTDSEQVRDEAAQFGVPCHVLDGSFQPRDAASWDRGASARAADALIAHFALVRLAP
jgi:hypothetical protein